MMALFFFIAHEKGFKFHAQPQTGAYSCFLLYYDQHQLYKALFVLQFEKNVFNLGLEFWSILSAESE